jgi:hypothetical protein
MRINPSLVYLVVAARVAPEERLVRAECTRLRAEIATLLEGAFGNGAESSHFEDDVTRARRSA